MTETALFAAPEPGEADRSTGLLPSQMLREAVAVGREVLSPQPIADAQIQPASIDLRLGEVAYRVRASFLPGARASVRDKLDLLAMHRIDLTQGAVLEKDCVYIVPLLEYRRAAGNAPRRSPTRKARSAGSTCLPASSPITAPSSTACAKATRDRSTPRFRRARSASWCATGSSLVQLRIRRGSPVFSDTALRRLHEEIGLVESPEGAAPPREAIRDGLAFTVDVAGEPETGIVGYKARRHTDLIDVDRIDHYDPRDFWEPVHSHRGPAGPGGIVLDPHDFYILASREAVVVPPDHAAEMLPYDTFVGEFRVHFAGFFDPGFGFSETGGSGSRAVLEVRSHEVPFLIEDGQIIGRLVYERLIARPDKLYGRDIGSSYQSQGLALSKHFRDFPRR